MDIRSKQTIDPIRIWCVCNMHCIELWYDQDHHLWDFHVAAPSENATLWDRIRFASSYIFKREHLDSIEIYEDQIKQLAEVFAEEAKKEYKERDRESTVSIETFLEEYGDEIREERKKKITIVKEAMEGMSNKNLLKYSIDTALSEERNTLGITLVDKIKKWYYIKVLQFLERFT